MEPRISLDTKEKRRISTPPLPGNKSGSFSPYPSVLPLELPGSPRSYTLQNFLEFNKESNPGHLGWQSDVLTSKPISKGRYVYKYN